MPEPHAFDNLGAVERTPDTLDFGLATYQAPVVIPDVFHQDFSAVQVFDQDKYPTCGGHAGGTMNCFLQTIKNGPTLVSPKYLWKQIKKIDGFVPEVGTDMRSILKTVCTTGDCLNTLMPDALGASLADYTDPSHLTTAMNQDALNYKLQSYAFADRPNWEDMRQAIYQNKAVIARVACGSGWWKNAQGVNSWQEKDVLPLKLGTFASDHFIVLYGYDTQYIYFRNSWGTEWGRKGDGYFDKTYVPNIHEIGTALILPNKFIFTTNLWLGLNNNDVFQLQKRLGVDYSSGPGIFGQRTLAAVKAYQLVHNLPATGFCGVLTRASLNTSN